MILRGISNPVNDNDATNKTYVDAAVGQGGSALGDKIVLKNGDVEAYSYYVQSNSGQFVTIIPIGLMNNAIVYYFAYYVTGAHTIKVTSLTNKSISGFTTFGLTLNEDIREVLDCFDVGTGVLNPTMTGRLCTGNLKLSF